MKKQLLLLLAINFLFFLNSIGQSFYGLSDVISYTSGKVFSNTDNTVKIQIDDTHDEKRSKRSDSSNSLMDFDVECHNDTKTNK